MKAFLLIITIAPLLTNTAFGQDCDDCQSYGIDFLNDGAYFQNSDSSDPFTALQEFEGCANDTSNNVFVDSNGDQYECTLSQLQPDDTPQLVTCPVDKNELFDGEYSLLILSNNGGCEPIAYQRDFELSVGPQQTTTVSPTVVISSTTTPIVTVVQTVTQVITQTADPSTTTVPRATLRPTITKHLLPSITIVKKAILTVTKVKQIVNIISTKFVTTTPKCKPTAKRRIADPIARIAATILRSSSGVVERDAMPVPTARSGSTEYKRAVLEGRAIEPEVKARFLRERRERLALEKRSPDEPVVTVMDSGGEVVT